MQNKPDYNLLIIRYLDKTITPEENRMLVEWLKISDAHVEEFVEVRDLWTVTNQTSDGLDLEIALHSFRDRVLKGNKKEPTFKHTFIRRFSQYAAVVLLLITTALVTYYVIPREPEQVVFNRLITGADNKGEFILPDGTVVWLNKGSQLEYPEHFMSERKVRLIGEAYFEVTKSETNPFIVQVNDARIKVTGTQFMVQNYENRNVMQAVLVSGKIWIEHSLFPESKELFPGDCVSYSSGKGFEYKNVNTSDYISWINKRLVFDKRPLAEIITNMEGWYGIDINCPETFAQNTYMSFTIRDESVQEILDAMTLIAPLTYTWDGNILCLSQREENNN